MRLSRRSTLARGVPKEPREACSSSFTTYFRFWNRFTHFVWCGSIPECSMSGLVSTRLARARNERRASCGGSPAGGDLRRGGGRLGGVGRLGGLSWREGFGGKR